MLRTWKGVDLYGWGGRQDLVGVGEEDHKQNVLCGKKLSSIKMKDMEWRKYKTLGNNDECDFKILSLVVKVWHENYNLILKNKTL